MDESVLGTVEQDVPCRRCGYNVRGLAGDGHCPECHAPVSISLLGDLWAVIDPQWLNAVAKGCARLKQSATVLVWLGIIASVLERISKSPWLVAVFAVPVVYFIGATCHAAWMIATPHGAIFPDEPFHSSRRISRLCVVLLSLSLVLTIATMVADNGSLALKLALVGSPLGVVGAIGHWHWTRHMQRIAEIIDHPFVIQRAKLYRHWFLAGWVPFWIGAIGTAMLGPTEPMCLLIPGGLAVLAFGVLGAALPDYFSRKVEEYLQASEANWLHAEEMSRL